MRLLLMVVDLFEDRVDGVRGPLESLYPPDKQPTTAENLALRCRRHNTYEATLRFGEREVPVVREHARGRGELGPDRASFGAASP